MRFKGDEKVSIASAYFSVFVLIVLTAALSIILVTIIKVSRNLNEESISFFKSRFSKMNESLKESKRSRLIFFWKTLYLLRWLVTVIILIVL